MHHATGTFEVSITPEAQAPATEGALPTSRMGLVKHFSGGLTGTAHGTMLAAGAPKPGAAAAYVAIDQFQGSVDGKAGGFVLLHQGTMTKAGGGDLTITVAPDTGTGALAGIAGTLGITVEGGVHRYDFAYTLPE
ncbi:MAG: DUF3224 domain-containing protein [Sphingomonas sp.]|uniref:DUF3224 domain-containing protein n=1 Tax=Sphingomonas sp. TaxID=28214 RepID=UPI0025DE8572|nr:DUF3224 domain-containing protein [Sphingomonas sp.]MBX9881347.1 DUF3224 domain-containing protein [Sphingomonas sp.]